MKPPKISNRQEDIFKERLSSSLNPRHELIKLSEIISWDSLENEFASLYKSDPRLGGKPPKPIRLMVGILLLQHMHNLSDEQVVRMWVENPYWQFFCGYDFLQWKFPIDSSSLTRFRKRLGPEKMERIFLLTVSAGIDAEVVQEKDFEKVIVDTTVMPKHIEFPTDSKLYNKAREALVRLSDKHHINLRQNYNLVTKNLMRKISGYLHAKQTRRAKKEIKRLKTILGRVVRDVERKISAAQNMPAHLIKLFSLTLDKAKKLLLQKKESSHKLYSMHESEVHCISKGKAHKRYEFGCKVSLAVTHKQGFVVSSLALPGNPYDGHTLKQTLESVERITQVKVKRAFVDRGYKGHGITDDSVRNGTAVFISGQKRGVTKSIRKQLKRRSAIEPTIGHMKQEGKLGVCRLKGFVGDQINAILTAAGHNLRLILNHIRKLLRMKKITIFFVHFLTQLLSVFCPKFVG
jgi:IS5 family transposase